MIKGISDVRRLPRLGKIRLGEKKQNASGKEYPSKLDHFNFKDAPGVAEVYGDACKELDILIPVEDRDVFFSQNLEAWRQSALFCRCSDGDTAVRVRVGTSDGKNSKLPSGTVMDPDGEAFIKEQGLDCEVGSMFDMPCPGPECTFSIKKMCKKVTRLFVMLPKVPRFGCYEIDSGSVNGLISINSYVESIRSTAGRVSMIPLKLQLVPKDVTVDGKKTMIFHMQMVYEGSIGNLMAYRRDLKLLPAPIPEASMPSRDEREGTIPDDLMPHAGAALDAELETPPAGPTPAEAIKAKLAKPAPKALPPPAVAVAAVHANDSQEKDPLDDEGYVPGEDRAEMQHPADKPKAATPPPVTPKRF